MLFTKNHPSILINSLVSLFFILVAIGPVKSQNDNDLEAIYQATNRSALMQMGTRLKRQAEASKLQGLEEAAAKRWVVRNVSDQGRIVELKGVDWSGKPIYYSTVNLTAAKTVSANNVWSGGTLGLNLTGNGVMMREWDAGAVRPTHQELAGRVVMGDGATSLSNHSTHVAGTMLATGISTNAHGMANQSTLRAFDWNYDYAEMAAEAANGALLSNHSYIYIAGWYHSGSTWYWYGDTAVSQTTDYYYGFYLEDAAIVDQIAFDAPYYLVCKAAGNDRLGGPASQPVTHYIWAGNNWVLANAVRDLNGGPDGWECISSGFSVSKNILTVGAVYDIPNGYSSPGDVVHAAFSGTGPTDDGRIKPDIVANGIGLYSTLSGGNSSYGSMSGTSMATPNAAGSLLLLQEHYHTLHGNFMLAATIKGLAIHTSDEAGPNPGPDYKFGWGLLNVASAANTITQVCTSVIQEATLVNGSTFTLDLDATGTEPLVATLSWTDPAGTPPPVSLNPPNLMLVNDLDMRIDGDSYKPYILDPANIPAAATTGDNFRDNVEKIYIQNPAPGNHTLTITHKNSLAGGSQNFSLIVTGLSSNFFQGTISASQTICSGTTPVQLTGTPPTGALVPYTYQWQSSPDNINFTNIGGATGLDYQPGTLTSTTYFRLMQTSAGSCGSVYTNFVTITTLPLPVPGITGIETVCAGTNWTTYTTEPGMTGYNWEVSSGGTITDGAGTNQITVTWNIAGAQTVSVNYTDANSCTASNPTVMNITVYPLPVPTIEGTTLLCEGTSGVTYSTETGMPGYVWLVSQGGEITSGAGTYQITVTWITPGAQTVSVNYSNQYGCNALSATIEEVTVYPVPSAPVISANGYTLVSDATDGNQWHYEGTPIPGANGQNYIATLTGWYWDVVSLNGCSSDTSNHLYLLITGSEEFPSESARIFPVPNDGLFKVLIKTSATSIFSIRIYNQLGQLIFEKPGVTMDEAAGEQIDLRTSPGGIYTLVLCSDDQTIVRKIVISR
ncbi:S8 family serine peptidase [Bacteroidota bacterium]